MKSYLKLSNSPARVVLGSVVLFAVAITVFLTGAVDTANAKPAPPVNFEFSVTYERGADGTLPTAEEITQKVLEAGNIGSSGLDGVRSDFQIDSFFDIEYRLFGDPDFIFGDPDFLTIDIEIVALNLTGADPVPVIDLVGAALKGKEFRGHVTVLK